MTILMAVLMNAVACLATFDSFVKSGNYLVIRQQPGGIVQGVGE